MYNYGTCIVFCFQMQTFSNVSRKPPLLYFNDDLPVYSHTSISYTLSELVDILMSESLPEEKVCKKVQPLGVNRNCTSIINLDSVSTEDMKADGLGCWKSNGTRQLYFKLNRRNGRIPTPPYDLTIARAEWHSYRDTCNSGNLITPCKETTSH